MVIRRVTTHGEKAAAYMADGYARASGRPGICMAQNVGAANLAAGLRDAYMTCSPVIAITGGPDPESRYRHLYQEVEDLSMFDAVTTFNAQVDSVERLLDLLRQAFREATTGTPEPLHLLTTLAFSLKAAPGFAFLSMTAGTHLQTEWPCRDKFKIC